MFSICFILFLINRKRYLKMVKNNNIQFFVENMKMKRKRDQKIDLPRRRFEPRIFEQIPAQNLNLEGD